jgi:hypothetical protein
MEISALLRRNTYASDHRSTREAEERDKAAPNTVVGIRRLTPAIVTTHHVGQSTNPRSTPAPLLVQLLSAIPTEVASDWPSLRRWTLNYCSLAREWRTYYLPRLVKLKTYIIFKKLNLTYYLMILIFEKPINKYDILWIPYENT